MYSTYILPGWTSFDRVLAHQQPCLGFLPSTALLGNPNKAMILHLVTARDMICFWALGYLFPMHCMPPIDSIGDIILFSRTKNPGLINLTGRRIVLSLLYFCSCAGGRLHQTDLYVTVRSVTATEAPAGCDLVKFRCPASASILSYRVATRATCNVQANSCPYMS